MTEEESREGGSNFDQLLRNPTHPSVLLKVPWESYVGIIRRLAIGGAQPKEDASEMGADDKGIGEMLDLPIGITKLKDLQTHEQVQIPITTIHVEHRVPTFWL